MRASKLLVTAAAAIVLLSAANASAKEELASANPWRDSEIDYEHGFTAYSLDKSADPDYNPVYTHGLTLLPVWHVGDFLAFKAKLVIEQELTNSDETPKKHEVVLNDLTFDVSSPGVTEGITGIKVSGGVRFFFPTSKVSQANTMRLAIGPAVKLSRKFALLEGLDLGYQVRFNFAFHQYTTAQQDAPGILGCTADDLRCGTDLGRRNMWGQLVHGPSLTFSPVEKLNFDFSFTFINSFLYGLAGDGQYLDDDKDVGTRHAQWFVGSVGYDVLDFLTVSLGFSTLYGDLALDGTYQQPFFNRYTQLSVGLALGIDPLIGKFTK